jgi:hypothetical protein
MINIRLRIGTTRIGSLEKKSPFSFERTGARLVARAYVEIKRNEHISDIPGATLH